MPNTRNIQVSLYIADAITGNGQLAAIVTRIQVTTRFFPASVVTGGRKPIRAIGMRMIMYTIAQTAMRVIRMGVLTINQFRLSRLEIVVKL